ncbi:MAG: type II toxin-antitoxin system Phd/YefM family antitoxin [Candidatus Binataceae bacterium]
MKTISRSELRNRLTRVLRQVEAGESMRVTVDGRPIADLVPIASARRWVPKARVLRLLEHAPLDRGFARDIAAATGATIDDL